MVKCPCKGRDRAYDLSDRPTNDPFACKITKSICISEPECLTVHEIRDYHFDISYSFLLKKG